MHFSRVISFVFLFALGALTLASPTPQGLEVVKRTGGGSGDNTDAIKEILSTAESVVEEVLSEVESIIGQKNGALSEIESLLGQVVTAITNARLELQVFGGGSLGSSVNATAVALELEQLVAEAVQIVKAVDKTLPGLLAMLTSGLDISLSGLINELNGLVPNVESLLSQLLNTVSGITSGTLGGISLGLVAGLLTL